MKFAALLLALLLAACGGGGGSGPDAQPETYARWGDSLSSGDTFTPPYSLPELPVDYMRRVSGLAVIDCAVAGSRVAEVLQRPLDTFCKGPGVATVHVMRYGSSDAVLGTPLDQFLADYERLIDAAVGRVILVGLFPLNARVIEFDGAIQAMAGRRGLKFIPTIDVPGFLLIDGTHPDSPYMRAMEDVIVEGVRHG